MSNRKQGPSSEATSQTRLSPFFSQTSLVPRSKSPIDLTLDSDESDTGAPLTKKSKTSSSFFTPSSIKKQATPPPQPGPSNSTDTAGTAGMTERYRFDPSVGNGSAEYALSQKRRRERAKKILLGNKNIFTHHEEVAGPSPSDEEEEEDVLPLEPEAPRDDSDADPEAKFLETISFFTNSKAKGKGRTKPLPTPTSKRKTTREIGPSGEPYTPLELQVSLLHLCSLSIQVLTC